MLVQDSKGEVLLFPKTVNLFMYADYFKSYDLYEPIAKKIKNK